MKEQELTAGLEVHQQLETRKLFSATPSVVRDDQPDFVIERFLRAAAGESGAMDLAASHEQRKAKRFYYQGYHDTISLIELDEEPVTQPANDAITVAMQVAKLLGIKPIEEVHVMRKTVVDGSNTSGFQRTMLLGRDGTITVDGKKVHIEQLCLEEDSCKLIKREDDHDIYNLSRLGIPLVEITTGPDLHSADEVKRTAAHLGMLLRSTERVKRGLGTIRQDVNVSVPGGERVEIKGAQDLDSLHTVVDIEAARQRTLLVLKDTIPAQDYHYIAVSKTLAGTKAAFIAKALARGEDALGIKLVNWRETLGAELMPSVRLGKELSGYAKAHGFGGLIHSSEDLSKYPLTAEHDAIRNALGCAADDGWIIMIGQRNRLESFLDHVLIPRLKHLSIGVPSEVRKAEQDGTTSYLRPMPGASRMYPETDVRPFALPSLDTVPAVELIADRSLRLQREYTLSADLADQLCREGLGTLFEEWTRTYPNVGVSVIANLLTSKERELKTRHQLDVDISRLGPHVLGALNTNTITIASVEDILVALAKGEAVDFTAYTPVSDDDIMLVAHEFVRENPGAKLGLLMGKVMRHFQNRADGKKVQEALRKAGAQ